MDLVFAGQIASTAYTDLILVDGYLVATTRYGGQIDSYDETLTIIDTYALTHVDLAGIDPNLVYLQLSTGPAILTGGGVSGDIQVISVTDGYFGQIVNLGQFDWSDDISVATATVLPNGQIGVYSGFYTGEGLGRLRLTTDAELTLSRTYADQTRTFTQNITAVTTATYDGADYLLTTALEGNGLSVWYIGWNGFLNEVGSYNADNGLWTSAPTDVETISTATDTFVLVAGAQSNSITVLQMQTGGTLQSVDHVIDGLGTRFAGITALAVVQSDGRIWVAAGGADDGITLFTLLPNGQLEPVAQIVDTVELSIADVADLEIQATDDTVTIYAASATEGGIAKFTYTINGDQVAGTKADDDLTGSIGDDILFDDAGVDNLTGGLGADVFVFAADGKADSITVYEHGVDRIDISGWGIIRNIDQLTFDITDHGLSISYGDEVLYIQSDAELTPDLFTIEELVPISRYSNMTLIDTNTAEPETAPQCGTILISDTQVKDDDWTL
ncbi:hypothetical protein BVC71_13920 [Marivivens niveibacter]|uniref:Peptidase M10 serralysin C-terminal domain-containing protein n=1 Tax=Marivivens niveibacter TaxID=1930667 RepID=A0A251WV95_9RHOB|nr:hypothetical protein [Marivivens niveibacter]OUD08266.1 hypothetical protein BVC71_13920 [Marivivens niveibacter]